MEDADNLVKTSRRLQGEAAVPMGRPRRRSWGLSFGLILAASKLRQQTGRVMFVLVARLHLHKVFARGRWARIRLSRTDYLVWACWKFASSQDTGCNRWTMRSAARCEYDRL